MPDGNITKPIIDLCKIILSTGIRRDISCQYWSDKNSRLAGLATISYHDNNPSQKQPIYFRFGVSDTFPCLRQPTYFQVWCV